MRIATGVIIAGKYELESPLARGGMGAVWVARHTKLGSRLAVKFLDPSFAATPSFIDRFEREARAAATLQSPHVVNVQDYGVEHDTPYLVMELLQGEDLEKRIRRAGRLSLQETASILVQLSRAMRKAHDAGIVHRDLKPANLFLVRLDDDEILKVLDFGIAKETANPVGPETKTGEVMGSPHYMSPEQARADKGLDHRADLWAIGVILYRMVTGAFPFHGEGLAAILSRILVDPVPPVATVAPDLPRSLDLFFARALAKDKEQRFSSMRDMELAFLEAAGLSRAPFASGASIFVAAPVQPAPPRSPRAAELPPVAQAACRRGDRQCLRTPLPLGPPAPSAAAATGPGTLTTANVGREVRSSREGSSKRRLPALLALAALVAVGFAYRFVVSPRAEPSFAASPDDTRHPGGSAQHEGTPAEHAPNPDEGPSGTGAPPSDSAKATSAPAADDEPSIAQTASASASSGTAAAPPTPPTPHTAPKSAAPASPAVSSASSAVSSARPAATGPRSAPAAAPKPPASAAKGGSPWGF
ncbi:MAG: serine/threonine-protein kinase [Polyangiaceae bacterium]